MSRLTCRHIIGQMAVHPRVLSVAILFTAPINGSLSLNAWARSCQSSCDSAECAAAQGKQSQSSLQYDRLQALDSPALRAGNWGQLCVTCKVWAD